MNLRIVVDVIIVLLVLFGPWWLALGLVVAASIYFKDFFEGLVVAVWFDLIYGTGLPGWWAYFPITIGFIIWWFLVEWLRDVLI